jgi:hypothetical protein
MYEFNDLPNPTLLGSAKYWVQAWMGLATTKPSSPKLGQKLSLIMYGFDDLLGPALLSLTKNIAQSCIGMMICQIQLSWAYLSAEPKHVWGPSIY